MRWVPDLVRISSRCLIAACALMACVLATAEDAARPNWRLLGSDPPPETLFALGSLPLRSRVTDFHSEVALQFSPDGKQLVALGKHCMELWDVTTGGLLKHVAPPASRAFAPALQFSPDGHSLLVGRSPHGIFRWRFAKNELEYVYRNDSIGHAEQLVGFSADGQLAWSRTERSLYVRGLLNNFQYGVSLPERSSMAVSADGTLLASVVDHRIPEKAPVRIRDLSTGHDLHLLGRYETMPTLLFSHDAETLFVGHPDGGVQFWDVANETLVRQIRLRHANLNRTIMTVSSDDGLLAVVNRSNSIEIIDTATGNELLHLPRADRGAVSCLAFSPVGHLLAVGSQDHGIELWDTSNGQERFPLVGHQTTIGDLAVSPDGQTIASIDERRLVLWNRVGAKIAENPGHGLGWSREGINQLEFSGDGRRLLVSTQGKLTVFDAQTLAEQARVTPEVPGPQRVVFSPFVFRQAMVVATGAIHVYSDVDFSLERKDRQRKTRVLNPDYGETTCLSFSSDGELLVGGSSSGKCLAWNIGLKNGAVAGQYGGHTQPIQAVTCSPDLSLGVSASLDQSVHVWSLANSKKLQSWSVAPSHPTALAFHPSAWRLAVGCASGAVYVWNTETGELQHTLRDASQKITCLTWSPDGELLVLGGDRGTLWWWRPGDAAQARPVVQHKAAITVLDWLKDGQMLATGDAAGNACLWEPGKDLPSTRIVGASGEIMAIRIRNDFLHIENNRDQTFCGNIDRNERTAMVGDFPHRDEEQYRSFALSPDGKALVAATGTTLRWQEGLAGPALHHLELAKHWGHQLRFSSDGRWLAVGGNELALRSVANPAEQIVLAKEAEDVYRRFALSPVEPVLVGVLGRNSLGLWDIPAGTVRREFPRPRGEFEITPDGFALAMLQPDSLQLIELETGHLLHSQPLFSRQGTHFALLDDGRKFVYADNLHLGLVLTLRPLGLPAAEGDRLSVWWHDLKSDRGSRIYRAVWGLTEFGDKAVALFEVQFRDEAAIAAAGQLRASRAAVVLAHIKSARARALLEKMSHGDAESPSTRAAQRGLAYLRNREAVAANQKDWLKTE